MIERGFKLRGRPLGKGGMMEHRFLKIGTFLLILLGLILVLVSLFLPWFIFAGTAEHALGTVWVSGNVSAFGIGATSTGTHVTMWSSTQWSAAGSDFWFGYLSVAGVLLISTSALLAFYRFAKKEKQKISESLVLVAVSTVGCLLVASTSLIAILYYKPRIFVIFGQIYGAPPIIDSALLYASRATVKIGIGPWLSIIGAFLCITGAVLETYHAESQTAARDAHAGSKDLTISPDGSR